MADVEVIFVRTAERRYGVAVEAPGRDRQWMNPGPGFDPDIPHDLVHYLVESECRLTGGVFGRIAAGGALLGVPEQGADPRERRRRQRRTRRREERLNRADREGPQEMARSERLAGICFLAWKVRHGQIRRLPDWATSEALAEEDRVVVDRVMDRLDRTAVIWRGLPIGGGIAFAWPDPDPLRATSCA